jgi:sterol desaturase/sphingolipid hydroxylase (fatty acid hydroxylase superfamily)
MFRGIFHFFSSLWNGGENESFLTAYPSGFLIHGTLLAVAAVEYMILERVRQNMVFTTGAFVAKNYALLFFVEYITTRSLQTNPENVKRVRFAPVEHYVGEFHWNLCMTSAIETLQYWVYCFCIPSANHLPFTAIEIVKDGVLFLPTVFFFEIIFDFFHYWMHRITHQNAWLYIHIHKKHHVFHNITSYITFYQHPVDILLTNGFPTMMAILITNLSHLPLYRWGFHFILVYKTFVDIGGHLGKQTHPHILFCLYGSVPSILGIQMYPEHHETHHTLYKYNYGKGFTLWDKVFGTYRGISKEY